MTINYRCLLRIAELTDELDEIKCSKIDLELQHEKTIIELEKRVFEKITSLKKSNAQLLQAFVCLTLLLHLPNGMFLICRPILNMRND